MPQEKNIPKNWLSKSKDSSAKKNTAPTTLQKPAIKRTSWNFPFFFNYFWGQRRQADMQHCRPKNIRQLQKLESGLDFFEKIPTQGMFEDDFPFPKVGYVIVPWRVNQILRKLMQPGDRNPKDPATHFGTQKWLFWSRCR